MTNSALRVLVTGAQGYVGRQVVAELAALDQPLDALVALDIRAPAPEDTHPKVAYCTADIRDPDVAQVFGDHRIDTVVHLAAIVTPGKNSSPEFEYAVDVGGTENILRACVETGVGAFVFTSSGAAYGYHADNPQPLRETDPLRGNDDFPYSRHKRLIEEMLARYREEHPHLRQLIFRSGAVFGPSVANQISALFEKPFMFGIWGADSPFTFTWDKDLVACVIKGVIEQRTGIYNVVGDGMLTPREIARYMRKPYMPIPAWLLRGLLAVLHPLGLSQYGPEQVNFVQYRPVLANDRLKADFGYTPHLSSRDVFELYWRSRTHAAD